MLLESHKGKRLICDPYDTYVGYKPPAEKIDIATVSHNHSDHNAVNNLNGSPSVISTIGEFIEHGIKINGIYSWHDAFNGSKRGPNIIYKIEMDNIVFVHLGDLGHILNKEHISRIRPCDILAVPVGGGFTVDAEAASKIVDQVNPRIVIPMHYHTPSNTVNLDPVEWFSDRYIEVINCKTLELVRSRIPKNITVNILKAYGEK